MTQFDIALQRAQDERRDEPVDPQAPVARFNSAF